MGRGVEEKVGSLAGFVKRVEGGETGLRGSGIARGVRGAEGFDDIEEGLVIVVLSERSEEFGGALEGGDKIGVGGQGVLEERARDAADELEERRG